MQYIHHLKENEARNIEKWTLEKLLMDQAMGDLQAQLEEVRRLWDEERLARQRAEAELDVLRGLQQPGAAGAAATSTAAAAAAAAIVAAVGVNASSSGIRRSRTPEDGATGKRRGAGAQEEESEDARAKRHRVD